ncbi:hypothetical protein PRUB_a3981 [Pseudoalteromonas rubra]|uniref:Uncharacterized protein n=1 Tax=Pseudoalteromonas rubra TaxID=43658 RepID=A0A8T0C8M0_9GAMM|nr:hypothetical protein PRUB_a3981 [Pseudoalteromonas rubra]
MQTVLSDTMPTNGYFALVWPDYLRINNPDKRVMAFSSCFASCKRQSAHDTPKPTLQYFEQLISKKVN